MRYEALRLSLRALAMTISVLRKPAQQQTRTLRRKLLEASGRRLAATLQETRDKQQVTPHLPMIFHSLSRK